MEALAPKSIGNYESATVPEDAADSCIVKTSDAAESGRSSVADEAPAKNSDAGPAVTAAAAAASPVPSYKGNPPSR